jgi:hypothetical protein
VPAFYDVSYLADGRIQRVAPRAGLHGVPWRVSKHTVMDLDAWPYPKQPLVRWPSRCTSGCRSRSSGAAPGAAGSARRG